MNEKRKLSDRLKDWRAERPDEWTMDEFIRDAKELEQKPVSNVVNPLLDEVGELVEAQEKLIEFYEDYINSTSAYLAIHRQLPNQEAIDKGVELREKVKSLKANLL